MSDKSPLLNAEDLLSPHSLVIRLRNGWDPVSKYLKEHLSHDTQVLLNQYGDTGIPSEHLIETLVQELNNLLQTTELYNEQRFAKITLSEAISELLHQNPTKENRIQLNRWLLEAAYPGDVLSSTPAPPASSSDHIFNGVFGIIATIIVLAVLLAPCLAVIGWGVALYNFLSSKPMSLVISILSAPIVFILVFCVSLYIALVAIYLSIAIVGKAVYGDAFFTVPPRRILSGDIGISHIGNVEARSITIPALDNRNILQFVTEGVDFQEISNNEWELHILFSLFNHYDYPLNIYDMHAQAYYQSSKEEEGPVGRLTLDRTRIILYQDNSILSNGKVYDIPPDRFLPLDLAFRISRVPNSGYLQCVFGLFIDYHYVRNSDTVRARISSDSVYLFQNPPTQWGQLLNISDSWLTSILEDSNISKEKRRRIIQLRNLLEKHKTLQCNL